MSRLWLAASMASIIFMTVSLCAEKGKLKDRLFVAGWVALAVEYIAWVFV